MRVSMSCPDDHSRLTVKEVNSTGIVMTSCWQPEKVWDESKTRALQGHNIHWLSAKSANNSPDCAGEHLSCYV